MTKGTTYERAYQLSYDLSKRKALSETDLAFLRSEIQNGTDVSVACTIMNCFRQIGNASDASFIEPYLHKCNVELAKAAIWTLCWLGQGESYKSYIIQSVEPGFSWDTDHFMRRACT